MWICVCLVFPLELNGACGGAEANGLPGAEGGGGDGGGEDDEEEVPVDENLFTGEDLDELDEELNTLGLEDWGWTDLQTTDGCMELNVEEWF